jgi:uncharacterized membrane protein YkoI
MSAAAIACVAAAGTGAAVAGGTNRSETADENAPAIAGAELDRASAAALAHTGQGRVTETEVGDEESYYEVEVTLDDGSQVDVQLDEQFSVVGDKEDREAENEADG